MNRIISTFIAIVGLTLLAIFDASAATATATGVPAQNVRFEWPAVNGLAINNACATEDSLYSLAPIQVCVATGVAARHACLALSEGVQCRPLAQEEMPRLGEVEREDLRCTTREFRQVQVSRHMMDVSCAEYSNVSNPGTNDCIRYVRRAVKVGRNFFVPTFERRANGAVYVGDTPYEIPECRSSN